MTIKKRLSEIPSFENEYHCDGPTHVDNTLMLFETITVSHGYASPFDGSEYHFCGLDCMTAWNLDVSS
jgi:hypothetical protein